MTKAMWALVEHAAASDRSGWFQRLATDELCRVGLMTADGETSVVELAREAAAVMGPDRVRSALRDLLADPAIIRPEPVGVGSGAGGGA